MVLGWWCGCSGKVGDGSRGGGREVVGGHSSRGGGPGGCASCNGDVSGVVASAMVVALGRLVSLVMSGKHLHIRKTENRFPLKEAYYGLARNTFLPGSCFFDTEIRRRKHR